jgi:hypothetical protein
MGVSALDLLAAAPAAADQLDFDNGTVQSVVPKATRANGLPALVFHRPAPHSVMVARSSNNAPPS